MIGRIATVVFYTLRARARGGAADGSGKQTAARLEGRHKDVQEARWITQTHDQGRFQAKKNMLFTRVEYRFPSVLCAVYCGV